MAAGKVSRHLEIAVLCELWLAVAESAEPLMLLPVLGNVARSYALALDVRPLLTNCITSSCLAVTADGIAQRLDVATETWDAERTAWMSVWGWLVSGVVFYVWLQLLNSMFPRAATSVLQLVGKVSFNQLVMSPMLNGGFFTFVIVTRVQPRGRMPAAKREMLRDKLARDLLPTIARSCTFWGVVQSVNFRFVPLRLQVLFSSSAYLVWQTYVSWVANRGLRRSAE